MKVKVIKKHEMTGREQRYEPVVKQPSVDQTVKANINQWVLEYKAKKLQAQLAAYDFRNIQ